MMKKNSESKQQTENESSLKKFKISDNKWNYVGLFADTISGFLTWSLITHLPGFYFKSFLKCF